MGVVKGQGHVVSPVSNLFPFLIHINQTNSSRKTDILKFDIKKNKVKVMGEVKGQGHITDPVSKW